MAYIDDASSRVYARFYAYEGTIPAMDSFMRYGQQYGIPLALYADKHSTDHSPAPPTVEEQLAGVTPTSQFGRALGELGVELIPPLAGKGRVERLFKTLQDRLVKELRLAGIATIEAANRFVEEWLSLYNQRFTVQPAQATDLHRPRPAHRELDRILCLKTTRCLRKDFTIAHQGGLYQIHETIRAPHVLVEEHVDGTMRITHQGRPRGVQSNAARPSKEAEAKKVPRPRGPVTPRLDHPWRTRRRPERTSQVAAAGT
jgi:hypothetical protein